MEKMNAYTKDLKLTDVILTRGETVPDGMYYIGCEVLVRHEDGSYLCMKRSSCKSQYPGFLEATAGGAALVGESNLQCIKRELKEETGIICDDFTELGYKILDKNQNIIFSYITITNCDKNSVKLQKGETEDFIWMKEEEFIEFINSDKVIDTQKERFYDYFLKMGYIKTL